jgi:hypothetical protein
MKTPSLAERANLLAKHAKQSRGSVVALSGNGLAGLALWSRKKWKPAFSHSNSAVSPKLLTQSTAVPWIQLYCPLLGCMEGSGIGYEAAFGVWMVVVGGWKRAQN